MDRMQCFKEAGLPHSCHVLMLEYVVMNWPGRKSHAYSGQAQWVEDLLAGCRSPEAMAEPEAKAEEASRRTTEKNILGKGLLLEQG